MSNNDKLTAEDLERRGGGDVIKVPADWQDPRYNGAWPGVKAGYTLEHDGGTDSVPWEIRNEALRHVAYVGHAQVAELQLPRPAASWAEDEPEPAFEPERVEVSRAAARRALEVLRAAPGWGFTIEESDIDPMQRAIAEALEVNKRDPKVVELEEALREFGYHHGAEDLAQHLADEGFQKVGA